MAENEARGLDFRPPGGESPRDVQERLAPLLAELDSARPILVTHKGVLRALYALATGWTMTAKSRRRSSSTAARMLSASRADGTPSVVELNIPLAEPRVMTRACSSTSSICSASAT